MRSRRLAVLSIVLASVVACAEDAGEVATPDPVIVTTATTASSTTTVAPRTTTAPTSTTEADDDMPRFEFLDPATFPIVELIEPGSEPRAVRTWMPRVGTVVAMTTMLSSESEQTGGGVDTTSDFEVTIGATTEIVGTTDEGFVARTVFDSAAVSSSDALVEGALESAYAELIGKEVDQLTRPDGAIIAQAGIEELGQGDVLGNGLGGIATPLPAEPIGIGAVWSADQVIGIEGIRLIQLVTTRLVDIQGDQLIIEIEATATLDPDSDTAGAFTLEGTSTGTATWDLSIGMPVSASSESIQVVEGTDTATPFTVRTVTTIEITAERVE